MSKIKGIYIILIFLNTLTFVTLGVHQIQIYYQIFSETFRYIDNL